jgi:predicted RNA-binding Zn-ribbon protein involved in translation (DUF1610 family)
VWNEIPNDMHQDELVLMMEELLRQAPNASLFVKWTCPNCGERAMSMEANTFHPTGYVHDDCGFLYQGPYYGFMAMFSNDDFSGRKGEDDE